MMSVLKKFLINYSGKMKAFLIFLLILVGVFLILYPFLGALIKDKRDLAEVKLADKYSFFFKTISNGLFKGQGMIHEFDDNPRALNMMSTDPMCQNMIVHFHYSTGNMIVELGYKYFHKEFSFQYTAKGLRNASAFTQKDLANAFVETALNKIQEFQQRVTSLLDPDQIVNHVVNNTDFEDDDPLSMIEHSFGGITTVQKEAVMCVGYLIATVNGDSEQAFTHNPVTQQQFRFFNIAWANCKQRLHTEGEAGVLSHLTRLEEHDFAMLEPFFSAMVISSRTNLPDENKINKLFHCMEAMGISESKYEEIATKNRLLMQMFSEKQ